MVSEFQKISGFYCRCSFLAGSPSQALTRQLSQRESLWQSTQSVSLCQGLSLWERWHGVCRDGEGEDADLVQRIFYNITLRVNCPSFAAKLVRPPYRSEMAQMLRTPSP